MDSQFNSTKKTRSEAVKLGMTILRAQFDKSGNWKIVRYTPTGSWVRYGWDFFNTRAIAETFIDDLVTSDPERFFKD